MHMSLSRLTALLLTSALLAAACSPGATVSQPPASQASPSSEPSIAHQTFNIPSFEPAALRWYCCLGTGEAPEQLPTENEVADGFAVKYPGSSLKFEVTTYDEAVVALSNQLVGNPPDIVGPNGIGGLGSFRGQWTDLGPYLAASNYDMSVYDPTTIKFFQQDGVQVGVPLDVYPSMLWYKRSFFEEAGLAEPPHKFGDKYLLDGTEVDWSYDTLRQVAMLLTVDINNKDATDPDFDPTKIEQFGFEPQRDVLTGMGAFWGAGSLVGPDGKTVVVPKAWADGWKFVYDGIWKDHFIMTEAQFASDKFGGNDQAFFSGRVAMSENFLWATWGITGAGDDWDVAAIPSHNGVITAPLNADTFSIVKKSTHQDAAFAAMVYLLQDRSDDLIPLYGGIPVRAAEQAPYLETLNQTEGWPGDVDWQVALDAVEYADFPNFEDSMPKYNETLVILSKYRSRWTTTPGLNMDQEIESLRAEVQAKWDEP
jgi:multiple sugar transport system substrate-binding protein